MATTDSTNPPLPASYQFRNLTGQQFGRLKVVAYAGYFPVGKRGQQKSKWHCRCECGNLVCVFTGSLTSGHTQSCGCLKRQLARERQRTHGQSGASETGEHRSWNNMLTRCYNSKRSTYRNYGGRGIRVCDRWRESFPAFLEDMGPRPSSKYTLERIDNDGHYEPGNCKWATRLEQGRNKRSNIFVTVAGVTRCVAEWCQINKINQFTAFTRISELGWSPEDAVTIPSRVLRRRKSTQ